MSKVTAFSSVLVFGFFSENDRAKGYHRTAYFLNCFSSNCYRTSIEASKSWGLFKFQGSELERVSEQENQWSIEKSIS